MIEAEHLGRYRWAAQLASGRDVLDAACGSGYGVGILAAAGARTVTGVDLDPEAVSLAEREYGELGTFLTGDVRELPCPDDSFDLVVSWETIEHVEESERAIAEFRRVLRDDGILLVSSPNPEVYPPGNEHHVHEYRPQELRSLVTAHFPRTRLWGQHARLASEIAPVRKVPGPVAAASGAQATPNLSIPAYSTTEVERSQPTFGIVLAGTGELPLPHPGVTMAEAFEVKWWSDQVAAAKRGAQDQVRERDEKIGELEAEMEARDATFARARSQATARASEAAKSLAETSKALYAANQELAQLPLLRQRIADTEARAQAVQEEIRQVYENSRSWRMTRPVRRLARLLRPRRRELVQ